MFYNGQTQESMQVPTQTKSFCKLVRENGINWFRVQGFDDISVIERMAKEFGLSSLDRKNILTPDEMVKIEVENGNVKLVLNNCALNRQDHVFSEHIFIFVHKNVIITFNETHHPVFKNVDKSIHTNTMGIRNSESGMLLAFLINSILVDLTNITLKMEKTLEKIEDTLLTNQYNQNDMGPKIQKCLHAYLKIRKYTVPLCDNFGKLTDPETNFTDSSLLPLFHDLEYQLKSIIQGTENSKEILDSLVELYASNNDLRTNMIMKRLTVVSTLFIPVTFLVGVWGMNFTFMPELDWHKGYLFAWAVLLATALGTWFFMKKKKWF